MNDTVRQMQRRYTRMHWKPVRVLVLGFAALIIAGALLLSMPMAARSGRSVGFYDALFTATSAVCVTGLSVVEVGQTFSLFGQCVLLMLIQAGGLGFMTVTSLVFMIMGRRITLRERLVIQE
ncbi:MAG: potassium transporter TrkG, partial [Candidatus Fimadaptatus sp.]